MANPSNPPQNIQVYQIPGIGLEVRATFRQANNLPATYARFQISNVNNFTNILYDSGQVAIQPIYDGQEGAMIFKWLPTSEGTYYYRLCFWDDANYTNTTWTVWNGTTVGEQAATAILRPVSDVYKGWDTIYPGSPTTHWDKVDDDTPDDLNTYIYNSNAALEYDTYRFSSLNDPLFKRVSSVTLVLRMSSRFDQSTYIDFLMNNASATMSVTFAANTWYDLSYSWTTNPSTKAPWTLNDINTIQAGVKSYDEGIYCTQVYISVAYYQYTFSYTPTNEKIVVHYPVFVSQEVICE
jgi:hypothetical protein